MKLKAIMIPMLCLFTALLVVCTKPDKTTGTDGGSSESPNGFIKGTMINEAGDPVAGAIVRVYQSNYIPTLDNENTFMSDTTNADGEYELGKVDEGFYNIEGQTDDKGVFIDSVLVFNDSTKNNIPPGILKAFGAVTGNTYIKGEDDTNQVRVTLYMPGTRRITNPNIWGRFDFCLMPEGSYQLIMTLNDEIQKLMKIEVFAGRIIEVDTIYILLEPRKAGYLNISAVQSILGVQDTITIDLVSYLNPIISNLPRYNKQNKLVLTKRLVECGNHYMYNAGVYEVWFDQEISNGLQDSLEMLLTGPVVLSIKNVMAYYIPLCLNGTCGWGLYFSAESENDVEYYSIY
jgi:hypothetical protein